MTLLVWPQVAAQGELQLWVGQFGTAQPVVPRVTIDEQPAAPLAPPQLFAIRDGRGANHQCVVRVAAKGPGLPHRVVVSAGNQTPVKLVVHTPPDAVPALLDGSFNLLLSSCYYQPRDAGGLLGSIVANLPVRPDMTLLAGDQIYGDLPLFEDLPEDEPALSQALGDKYRVNWQSNDLGRPGIQSLLTRAPTVCIPDDHEFWNNFPFRQAQLPNTWRQGPRDRWTAAAQALYEDYQVGGAPGTAPGHRRIDVDPLSMLLIDMRCLRKTDVDADDGLMRPSAQTALATWTQQLVAAQAAGRPRIGVLGTGQALFIPKPGGIASHMVDAEIASYRQSGQIEQALDTLAAAGVPVVFVTGDVHWGRVARARYAPNGRTLLYEVICSPSRLIDSPGSDQKKAVVDGLQGRRDAWPRHPDPDPVPPFYGTRRRFAPESVLGRKGDQVALLSFTRAGQGLDMNVTYYGIHDDPAVARPETSGPHTLLAH